MPLPPVTFAGKALPNRVETSADTNGGYTLSTRVRLETVTNETGGGTTIVYATPSGPCTSGTFPAPDANTLLCYPDYWTPSGMTSPILDWFNKYVVPGHADRHHRRRPGRGHQLRLRGRRLALRRRRADQVGQPDLGPLARIPDCHHHQRHVPGSGHQDGRHLFPGHGRGLPVRWRNVLCLTDQPRDHRHRLRPVRRDGFRAHGRQRHRPGVRHGHHPLDVGGAATQSQPSPLPSLQAYMTGSRKPRPTRRSPRAGPASPGDQYPRLLRTGHLRVVRARHHRRHPGHLHHHRVRDEHDRLAPGPARRSPGGLGPVRDHADAARERGLRHPDVLRRGYHAGRGFPAAGNVTRPSWPRPTTAPRPCTRRSPRPPTTSTGGCSPPRTPTVTSPPRPTRRPPGPSPRRRA